LPPNRSFRCQYEAARDRESWDLGMTQLIVLDTVFDAPIAELCALLVSAELHLDSMTHNRERVVAGRTTD